MGLFSDAFDSLKEALLPTVHAEEKESSDEGKDDESGGDEGSDEGSGDADGDADEEEEEEEPEDPAPHIRESCENSYRCKKLVKHFEECNERVEAKKDLIIENEDCTEELFHMLHCVDTCAAPKIWKKLV